MSLRAALRGTLANKKSSPVYCNHHATTMPLFLDNFSIFWYNLATKGALSVSELAQIDNCRTLNAGAALFCGMPANHEQSISFNNSMQ